MSVIPKNRNLYNQAIKILRLSRSISGYLHYDLSELDEKGNEQEAIYFTGDMVMHSDALAPGIIAAENQLFQDDRMRHALSVEHITQRLLKTCERLEHINSDGVDFLQLLRKELKKFRKLQKKWVLTL